VTDPVPPQGNYGDRLLEIAAARPIVDLMRSAVLRQPANRPLEVNMLQDVLAGELPTLLQRGYDDAVYKGENILKERGWIHVPINTKPPLIAEAARIWATTPRGRTDSRAAKAIEDLMQGLRSTEPQSELVNERMDELQPAFYEEDGPSRYGRLAIDYLRVCQGNTRDSPHRLVHVDDIKQAAALLEVAAKR